MAGFKGLSAVGTSIERTLNACFSKSEPIEGKTTKAILVQTEDFETGTGAAGAITRPSVSVFLYRIESNKTMRAAWSAVGSLEGTLHLPLDLHFLITAWAGNAEHEYQILGRVMQCLEARPILSGPLLDPAGGWAANEAIQVVLEDMTTEALMRTFDSLATHFRLSVPYLARVVRIDGDGLAAPTVVTAVTGMAGKAP
jgi:hypothetical protein